MKQPTDDENVISANRIIDVGQEDTSKVHDHKAVAIEKQYVEKQISESTCA